MIVGLVLDVLHGLWVALADWCVPDAALHIGPRVDWTQVFGTVQITGARRFVYCDEAAPVDPAVIDRAVERLFGGWS